MEESAEVGETDEENGKGIKCKWMKQNEGRSTRKVENARQE
jgi:hypothetical protein